MLLQLVKLLAPCVSPGAEKVTAPWAVPNPLPVKVIAMPGFMLVGEMLVSVGAANVNVETSNKHRKIEGAREPERHLFTNSSWQHFVAVRAYVTRVL